MTSENTLRPVRRIGLTGGIGSGKSEVARVFAQLGARVIDADQISHALTQAGGAAMAAIRHTFGDAFMAPDGALNRTLMRKHIFSNPEAKRHLEAILHPLIRTEIERQASAAPPQQVLVFDVPLLAESTPSAYALDRILVVDCERETQIQRVMRRSKWSRSLTEQVIDQQVTRACRRAVADAVIVNDGIDLVTLQKQVEAVWNRWASQV